MSKGVRVLDRVFYRQVPRQSGGDRRRKSTARAMRVVGVDPGLGYFPNELAVPHDVHRNARVIAMAAFHHHDRGKIPETAGGPARIVEGLELLSQEHACLEKVRGGHG